jgi:hypothetical protein
MNYKAPDNSIHFLDDDSFVNLLPAGSIAITPEEAEALHVASLPVVDPKDVIKAQIASLEQSQLMPRATREFMLMFMEANATPEILAANFGYQAVKAFDLQIKALRDQL